MVALLAFMALLLPASGQTQESACRHVDQASIEGMADDTLLATARCIGFRIDPACPTARKVRILRAVLSALDQADGCLQRLNPGLAARMQRKLAGTPPLTFHCEASSGISGGHTVRGGTNITLNFAGGTGQDSLPARTFHEMLHSLDDREPHLCPMNHVHNRNPGFPDPVYACQYACYPDSLESNDSPGNRLQAAGTPIPELASYSCPPSYDSALCPSLRRYAQVCHGGRFLTSAAMRTEARVSPEFTECLMLAGRCASAACTAYMRTATGSSTPEPQARLLQQRLNTALRARLSGAASPDAEADAAARDLVASESLCLRRMGL